MNTEVQHLYAELSTVAKEELWKVYEQAPKMLLYLQLLETSKVLNTPKAVQVIYEEEYDTVEHSILVNRFYKLRKVLRIQLLDSLKNVLKSQTEEEIELKFLQLLLLKNEHAYVLDKAQKLEKHYWKANLFELLPDLLHMIISALHYHRRDDTDKIAEYIEKLDLANELQYTLYKFKNHINSFRLQIIGVYNLLDISKHYTSTISKMRRKVKQWKEYKRLELIYHYTSFTIGAQLQNVVAQSGNAITRHLNQLETILKEHPDMPIMDYMPNHRQHYLNNIALNKAVYWYQKGNSKKSYQSILDYEKIMLENAHLHLSESGVDFNNILLCCWAAKEYETMLKYTDKLKEFQIGNSAVKAQTPYFVYELLAYVGLYPKHKHPNPEQLILTTEKYLETADENFTWIYSVLGTFAMLYGAYKKSRRHLEHPLLLEEYRQVEGNIPTIELLNALETNSREAVFSLLKRIHEAKKKIKDRDILTHLEELEMLTKAFL